MRIWSNVLYRKNYLDHGNLAFNLKCTQGRNRNGNISDDITGYLIFCLSDSCGISGNKDPSENRSWCGKLPCYRKEKNICLGFQVNSSMWLGKSYGKNQTQKQAALRKSSVLIHKFPKEKCEIIV